VRRVRSPGIVLMFDRGLFLSLLAIRRQLAAMPQDLYLVRLIHHATKTAFPGERLWTAAQLGQEATVRFLRIRNREGCDVYLQPYADNRNAGYILLDLDHTDAATLERMRVNGHQPCVVLQTSPGHLQAWIQVSAVCLEPATATVIARQLAHTYGGDLASADWRHLGRLAGFTNQKPLRRQDNGYAPWVRLLRAQVGLATNGASLVEAAGQQIQCLPSTVTVTGSLPTPRAHEVVIPASSRRPATSIRLGCSDCGFHNDSRTPIGVSPTSGSPKSCCDEGHPWLALQICFVAAVRVFLVITLTPRITCVVRWHGLLTSGPAGLFPRRCAAHTV
jgi:hypothetical protein